MPSVRPSFRRARTAQAICAAIEALESRTLLASVTVNAGTTLRNVDMKWLAVNTAPWTYMSGVSTVAPEIVGVGM